jgi:hypothetical protein
MNIAENQINVAALSDEQPPVLEAHYDGVDVGPSQQTAFSFPTRKDSHDGATSE